MNYPSYRENHARQQQINISVSTNVNGGSNPFDTQLSFDSANKESINQSNINGTKLKQYPFYEIPFDVQESTAQKISSANQTIDKAINLYSKKVMALIKLKSAILAQELQHEAA